MKALASLFALLLMANTAGAQAGPDSTGVPAAHVGRLALFVLAGQSNMSGRGDVPSDAIVAPDVFVFGNDYRWHPGREPVDSPAGQVDSVSLDRNAGFGPSLAFAQALTERYPGLIVGLIPCAKGATIIEAWQRSPSDASLYGSCLKRIRAASPMGRLEGLLFFQGESDTHRGELYQGLPRRPHTWGRKFTTLVNDVRRDLGRPDLPVVFAQIGVHASPDRYVNWEVVQAEQARVQLPNVRMIETSDLALRDRVHYDTPSYRTIGRRFADAMAALLDTAGVFVVDLQGHRGARGLLPENTVPAFRRALELGVNTLELDLAVSKDGRLVVSHEPWMSAGICTTPDGQPVPEAEAQEHNLYVMTYDEIARYDCGSRGNARFPEQVPMRVAKPLLDSVIVMAEHYAAAHGRPPVRYNVEIKSKPEHDGRHHPEPPAFARLVHEALAAHGVLARTTVQSFDPRALEAMHALDPTATLALLVDNDLGLEANLERLTFTPDVYSPHHRLVDRALVEAAHRRGIAVLPWTVNDVETMRRLVALGVDGLITDYPDRGRAALGR